jgi:hypothetical protein
MGQPFLLKRTARTQTGVLFATHIEKLGFSMLHMKRRRQRHVSPSRQHSFAAIDPISGIRTEVQVSHRSAARDRTEKLTVLRFMVDSVCVLPLYL